MFIANPVAHKTTVIQIILLDLDIVLIGVLQWILVTWTLITFY